MHRRSFLIGASGLTLVAVSACTSPQPTPTPTVTPTPTPELAVPRPARMARSSWGADPYAGGAFSYLGIGSTPDQRNTLATSVADRLFFAGEATSIALPGTVVGAQQTGVRAAIEVAVVATPGERIAVIGAGVAGATAARHLTDAGFTVTVLEARTRTGGRLDTTTDSDWPMPVELGAGFLDSVSAAATEATLTALGVITVALAPETSTRTPDGLEVTPSTIGAETVKAAIAAALPLPGDITIATALLGFPAPDPTPGEGGVSPADWVNEYLRNDLQLRFGAGADELSAKYALTDGTRTVDRIVLGGFAKLVSEALDGIDVWTSNVVSRIAHDENGVNLRFATGESLQVDRVIVTVPLGVLKARSILFEPQLPLTHIVATTTLEMGTVDKIWVEFDEPFWSTDAVRWSVAGGDLDITEWVNLQPATGSPVLIGLVGGERAAAIAELDDDQVVDRARRSLEPFLTA